MAGQNPYRYRSSGSYRQPCNPHYYDPAHRHSHMMHRRSYYQWRRRSHPPDLLDKMFASARASLTALCLSVRAVDGHPVGSSPANLQLAKTAARSQAAACIAWITAISAADVIEPHDDTNPGGGLLLVSQNDPSSCPTNPSNQSRSSFALKLIDSMDSHEASETPVLEEEASTPLMQSTCDEKDLVVVEEATSTCVPEIHINDNHPTMTNRPNHETPPTSQWLGTSQHLRRRSIGSQIRESNSILVERMKALALQEKQPDLKDSDFLFDADFEAFLP